MREIDGIQYLTAEEAKARYGWQIGTLYYFRSLDLLKNYKFIGDKKRYWAVSELEALKNRPPEEVKRGPKSRAMLATI